MTDQKNNETPNEKTTPAGEGAMAIASSGGYYVIVAQFPDTTAARGAYETLRELERTTTLQIDGVVVAHRAEDGKINLEKMTDHSTRTGLRWGVVGGIVVGVLFPPTILAGAIGAGSLGAVIGKIRNMGRRSEIEKALADSLDPGTSGIIALVEDKAVVQVQQALDRADRIVSKAVDRAVAMEIDAEAEAAKAAAGV